jgi:CDP-diacylglycerol---glycerol-3-phosphate 3-phosphatidyltransferase
MNPAIVLTFSRIVIAPFFAVVFIRSFNASSPGLWLWLAVALAGLIELSDAFDGHVARARNQVTDFGKLFDPAADSIARQTIFLSFMVCKPHIIPLWMFLLFLYRDAFLSVLRMWCAYHGIVLAARRAGKLKAVVQAIGAFLVLFVCLSHAYHCPMVPLTVWGRHPGFWIMLVPAIVTVLSVYDYVVSNWRTVQSMMIPNPAKPD